ncbi:MAG: membrane protein insertion efficiency factor YidD, partial [Sphingobacteriaceae bacterium]
MRKSFFLLISSLITVISFSARSQIVNAGKESSSADYIGFYQKYISNIRGQNCPMYPSCSRYALAQFKQTYFLTAMIRSSERLTRCGHDLDNYAITTESGEPHYLDYPAGNNSPDSLIYKYNNTYYSFSDTAKKVDSAIVFIYSLINNGFYQQALLEIKRYQFINHEPAAAIYINELICLKALGEYEKAIYEYEIKFPVKQRNNPHILA